MLNPQSATADVPTKPYIGLDIDKVRELGDQRLVLIVDDDDDIVDMLKLILRNAGFNVAGALDGEQALEKFAETTPDIVLLDLLMPEMDGWQVLEQIQSVSEVPVMIISAVGLEDSVARALDSGADDYVRKPFTAKEVVARVRAALRRSDSGETQKVRIFPRVRLMLNLETRQVWLDDEQVKLSPHEFAVLAALAHKAPRPVTYEEIGERVWDEDSPKVRKRLKWTIHLLRRKLEEEPSKPELIVNHVNYGYQLQT